MSYKSALGIQASSKNGIALVSGSNCTIPQIHSRIREKLIEKFAHRSTQLCLRVQTRQCFGTNVLCSFTKDAGGDANPSLRVLNNIEHSLL